MHTVTSSLPAIARPQPIEAKRFGIVGLAIGRFELAVGAALLVVWAFCNPFYAVFASSLIYTARAFADLDPTGVGRDIMFVHDGQSGFTILTVVLRALAGQLGLARASTMLAVAAMLVSFAAAMVLASTLARGRTRYLIVAFAAALPAQYGGYKLFAYAEVAATPRPFAEALVLLGLSALVARRTALAAILMSLAAALHPIMAASGAAILMLWLIIDDRRWLVVMAAGTLAAGLLSFQGVALFDRFDTIVDPQWAAILKVRNPHLFPSLWPAGAIGRAAARIATLVLAAKLAPPRVRRLFLLAIVVGLAGIGLSYGNERIGSLLLLQAQTWRMMWLVYALATAGAAICTIELWSRGGTARVALGLLALAWVYADYGEPAVLFALVAVGVGCAVDPKDYAAYDKPIGWVVALLAAWTCYGLAQTELVLLSVTARAPVALAGEARRTLALPFDYSPIAVLAAVWAIRGRPHLGTFGLCVATALGCLVLVGVWDQRSAANIYLDGGGGAPDLARLIATRPGEVYWVGGDREAWWWLHRPQWLSPIQGAGIVFSRDLAQLYKARADRAAAAGLADASVMAQAAAQQAPMMPTIRPSAVAAFCAEPDAPAWIIAPIEGAAAAGTGWTEWSAPIVEIVPVVEDDGYRWRPISRYFVIPCGGPLRPTRIQKT